MNIHTDLINCFVENIRTHDKFQIMGVFYYNGIRFVLLNEQNEFREGLALDYKYITDIPKESIQAEAVQPKQLLTETSK
jgi:hypothetical protein